MTGWATLANDGRSLTVRVRVTLRKHGGRKLAFAPGGPTAAPLRAQVDGAMTKALARAHRWKRQLETGGYVSVVELAEIERMNPSYLCRVLRLTLLAPDIVELILDGRQPATLNLDALLKPCPVDWECQRQTFGMAE